MLYVFHFLSLETLGTACGILSVLLLAKGRALGFLIGIINTFVYVYLDFHKGIYGQILVNIYYTGMNLWGLYLWLKKDKSHKPAIFYAYTTQRDWKQIAFLLLAFFACLLAMNFLFLHYGISKARTPVLDSFVTSLIFLAMWLSVRKKIEAWYFWWIINVIAMVLFFQNALYITILQYAVYLLISFIGWRHWMRAYHKQKATAMQGGFV